MKKTLLTLSALLFSANLSSFDWPQNEILSDSFYAYFGQLRGGTINTSLIFSESNEVKAADSGRILAIISEHGDDEIFESTLGNAVIIQHPDNMLTVYGNLEEYENKELFKMKDVSSGTLLGTTGTSGWQSGDACLEFQVVDTKNQNYINPRILMPRIGNELELTIKNLEFINRSGVSYNLLTTKTFYSGTYRIYRERQDISMPYKTSVYVNGALVDSISYETLLVKDGKICTNGKINHPVLEVYPDKNRQLLAEFTMPKGHNIVTVVVADILGKEKSITYNVDVR